jgi:hypothetical protein
MGSANGCCCARDRANADGSGETRAPYITEHATPRKRLEAGCFYSMSGHQFPPAL